MSASTVGYQMEVTITVRQQGRTIVTEITIRFIHYLKEYDRYLIYKIKQCHNHTLVHWHNW